MQKLASVPWILRITIGVGIMLVVGAFGVGVWLKLSGSTSGDSLAPPRIGQKLVDFSLQNLGGESVRLSDYEGQVVLVNFWATWCPPCAREMPGLNAFYNEQRERGFTVLAVNVGETHAQAESFAREYDLGFPILLDPDYELADRVMVDNYPTSILVGRDGHVKKIHIGYFSPEDLDLEIYPLIE